jgi:hypothetical protein
MTVCLLPRLGVPRILCAARIKVPFLVRFGRLGQMNYRELFPKWQRDTEIVLGAK